MRSVCTSQPRDGFRETYASLPHAAWHTCRDPPTDSYYRTNQAIATLRWPFDSTRIARTFVAAPHELIGDVTRINDCGESMRNTVRLGRGMVAARAALNWCRDRRTQD